MNLDSVFFLSCFLPVLALIYYLFARKRSGNLVLLCAGLLFYAFGGLSGLILLFLLASVNYALGLLLRRAEKNRKAFVISAVVLNLGYLCVFKYLGFLLSVVFPAPEPTLSLTAPIGISFITFKCISYNIDIYRNPDDGTDRFLDFLLWLSFFPQVTAGPLTRFHDFQPQLRERNVTPRGVADGVSRMIIGLSKKLLLAGAAARVADPIFSAGSVVDLRSAWIAAVAFMLQIFFDFSGYSDMAIGLGRIFGFATPENFDHPYLAVSVTDFWRRWHISLSSWFRDYLYIPLGGNRRGKLRTAVNKLIVFALCGLWHGAAWTFVLWGVWHGVFSALESLRVIPADQLRASRTGRIFSHIYTLAVVCLSFVFFRAPTLTEAWRLLRAMFGMLPVSSASSAVLIRMLDPVDSLILLIGTLLVAAGNLSMVHRLNDTYKGRLCFLPYAGCILLLLACIVELSAGGFAPFIYAQF